MLLIPRFLSFTFILFQVPDACIHHKNKMLKIYPLIPLKISVYAVSLLIFTGIRQTFPYFQDIHMFILLLERLAIKYSPGHALLSFRFSWRMTLLTLQHKSGLSFFTVFFFTEFIIICHCIFIYVWENCHGHHASLVFKLSEFRKHMFSVSVPSIVLDIE